MKEHIDLITDQYPNLTFSGTAELVQRENKKLCRITDKKLSSE